MEPCGTQEVTRYSMFSYLTFRSFRYPSMYLLMYAGTLLFFRALCISAHFTVLKAFCISTIIYTRSPLHFDVFRLSVSAISTTFLIASTVDLFSRNPYGASDSGYSSSRWFFSLFRSWPSTNLLMVLKKHSGQYADGLSMSALSGLGRSCSSAIHHSSGCWPFDTILLTASASHSSLIVATALIISGGMLFEPSSPFF